MSALAVAADLHEQIAQLTEERDYYKREAGLMQDRAKMDRICSKLWLTQSQAKMLLALYDAKGRPRDQAFLMDLMYFERPNEPNIKIIDVFLCKLRKKIGFGMVDTHWGRGYSISEAGAALVDAALGETVH